MDELESALDANLCRQLRSDQELDAYQMQVLYQTSFSLLQFRAGRAKLEEIPMHRHVADDKIETPSDIFTKLFGNVKIVMPLNHPDHPDNQDRR